MKRNREVELSKFLSYVLRHHPEEYGLSLDEDGSVNIDELIRHLPPKYCWVTKEDIQNLVLNSEKQRFEIKGNRIRATYGHSINIKIPSLEVGPPEVLFHGTSKQAVQSILKEGLKPQKRMFVHLCKDLDGAYKIGRRHAMEPIVLVIKAKEAYEKGGVKFMKPAEEDIYLSKFVPPEFISILQDEKAKIRERIWHMLESKKLIYLPTCYGRIPNFKGKEPAAKLLSEQDFFKEARCIFVAPDGALSTVREIILREGKTLIVALPRMTGFVQIEEKNNIKEASTIKGFRKYGKDVTKPIELFIQSAVAVDRFGNRLGKGSGFGDREWQYFKEKNLIKEPCQVVCLVHDLQVLDEDISKLMQEHDKKVDYIVTPTRVIKT